MSTTEQFDAGLRETVEVRRNAGLSALVGALAAAVAIAWLSRASQSGAVLDWVLVALMAVLAGGWLASFVDARTPLLVADDHGVRIRLGHAWQGLPWNALASVEHHPRQAWWRDGVLVLEPADPDRVLGEADASVRRRAWLNRRVYGAPLSVPLGLATRTAGAGEDLAVTLRRLAQGATPVLDVDDVADDDVAEIEDLAEVEASHEPALDDELVDAEAETGEIPVVGAESVDSRVDVRAEEADQDADEPAAMGLALRARRRLAGLLRARSSQDATDEDDVVAAESDDVTGDRPEVDEHVDVAPVAPVRPLLRARRSEVHQQVEPAPAEVTGRELRRDGRVSLVEEAFGETSDSPAVLVDEDVEPAPRPEPVIGPMLVHARERIGLSVDSLAERTRIRPHVIEAIEVDDFGPCGGDFYARGHLRTLGRVLGLEPGPLVKLYDERYADAPINARKVFEAELASGGTGIRAVKGGPNWSIVVAAVMAVILAWSVAKLATDDKPEPEGVMSLSQGSGGPNGSADTAERVTLKVTASSATHVEVRNAKGKLVFAEDLESGDIHRIDVVAPAKVKAQDAGAVEVEIDNVPQGTVGKAGQPGSKKFG